MIKSRLSYFFVDPASQGYSASRLASLFMIVVDTCWVATAVLGLPPKEAYVPVSSMLSACTVAAFTAYGVNSAASAWKQTGEAIASTVFRKTTTVTKDEGGIRGEEEKKTTTITSQVDSGPKEKVVPKPLPGE